MSPPSMTVPLLDLKAQYKTIREEIREAVDRVLGSQAFILGQEVASLEAEIAAYCQCEHGIGVSSGTDALLVSLMAVGIKPGDEVITTPYTFFATAGCVARLGAKPVFVDIDPFSFNMDPRGIEALVTERTKAILPVHLFGQVADMDPIMAVASRHGLTVIEDAAQAIGSEYMGRRAGSVGHVGCFSFFPSKNLGGIGDGGMVTTNDSELADRVKLLRNHGFRPKYHNKVVGGNFRLDAIQAAVLRVKLAYLDRWSEARKRNADTYRQLVTKAGLALPQDTIVCLQKGCAEGGDPEQCDLQRAGQSGVILPMEVIEGRHIYNQFVLRTPKRDALKAYLREHGVGSEVYYPIPLHLQECFADLGYKKGDLPRSECAASQTLALPIYPELTEEMLSSVVDTIASFFRTQGG